MPFTDPIKEKEYHHNYWLKNKAKLSQKSRERYLKNWEARQIKREQYRLKNPEKWLKYHREYYEKNREKIIAQNSSLKVKRLKGDVLYKTSCYLRTRIWAALKRQYTQKSVGTIKLLGAKYDMVKQHIESQFKEGMAWSNMGEWHIDHIIPLISFDLTNPKEQERACHYTNLQPLWALDNFKKGDKIL